MNPASFPLGPFALQGVVGRGAMAEVWHGVHLRQSLPVAVKVITDRGARDPEGKALFRGEALDRGGRRGRRSLERGPGGKEGQRGRPA